MAYALGFHVIFGKRFRCRPLSKKLLFPAATPGGIIFCGRLVVRFASDQFYTADNSFSIGIMLVTLYWSCFLIFGLFAEKHTHSRFVR